MNNINWYDKLATQDVNKVKEHLLEWTKTNPNGILLFNTITMSNIHKRMQEQNITGYITRNSLFLDNMAIVWDKLPGNKGILRSIFLDDETIYTQPTSWEECSLWYEFKN